MWLFRAFALSLVAHLTLLLGIAKTPIPDLNLRQPLEVEILEDKKPKKNPIDDKLFVKDNIKKEEAILPDLKTRFWAEEAARVAKETKAAASGLTKNRSGTQLSQENQKRAGKSKTTPVASNDTLGTQWVPKFNPTPRGEDGQSQSAAGASTVSTSLPEDIKTGELTALNAERFTYYSFFSRIEERIFYRWSTHAKNAMGNLDPKYLTRQPAWITRVEFVLDDRGYLVDAIVHQRSGIEGFDRAALDAFRAGAPFINPPRDLVRDDGRIHLTYNFTWHTAPL